MLVPNCTAANRAVNLPEFANICGDGIDEIDVPAVDISDEDALGRLLVRNIAMPFDAYLRKGDGAKRFSRTV